MVELKGHQQQEMKGKLQFHSCLTLIENILTSFEISQLEGLHVGGLLYNVVFTI